MPCARGLRPQPERAGGKGGVSGATAKRTIKLAELCGLISVQRRPRSGRKHLTNLVRVIRTDWIDWLKNGNRKPYAVKACTRAKPDFGSTGSSRGVKNDPPRSRVLRNRDQRQPVDSPKKERRTLWTSVKKE